MNKRLLAAGLGSLLSLGAAPSALALTIEYALDRNPALVACDKLAYRGARAEARACYQKLLAESTDPRIKGDAARASGDVRAANAFFQEALKQYPEDAAVRARWGELFITTHQNNEAIKLFNEALQIDENYSPAKLGLAKVAAGGFEEKAREWAAQVVEETPEASLQARLLLARADLEDSKVEDAEAKLDDALKVAEDQGLPLLEVYALKASADLLRGVTNSEWTAKALAANPSYGEAYATPAYFYVITRRYREAIELLKKAVAIEPDLYTAHSELGVNLLRENKIQEAQEHLQIAYRGDPFSAPIVNTLRLIDSFDNFVVKEHLPAAAATAAQVPINELPPAGAPPVTEAKPPQAPLSQAAGAASAASTGATAKNPGALLRMHKDEAAVLEPYVLDLTNRAIETYSKRYGFELKQPVIVELYPNHDDFAVRIAGLPGIGLLGVTFGYLVAMDSPTGRADSDFHWGTTLWHELAHVFTLEATNHLVPRWYSEGVSVYEEWSTGPLKGRHIPLPVFQAIKEDKLLPIADLDKGFIRPEYEAQVIVSYMQAGLICEYISSRWGQEGLEKLLKQYGAGKETREALQNALGISATQFDEDFAAYVEKQLGSVVAQLEPWQEAQQRAQTAFVEKDWQNATDAADKAIGLYPDYVDEGSAYIVKARAQKELGNEAALVSTLLEYRKRGGHDPAALISLAKSLSAADRNGDAIAVLDDVLMVAPLRPEVHLELGDRLLQAGDAKRAVVEYQALLAMNPHDLSDAHYRLAKAYFAAEDRGSSREHLLYALEIAPGFREAQQLLVEIVR